MYKYIYFKMKNDIYLARIYIEIRLIIFLLAENFMRERRTTDEDEKKDNHFFGESRGIFSVDVKLGEANKPLGALEIINIY